MVFAWQGKNQTDIFPDFLFGYDQGGGNLIEAQRPTGNKIRYSLMNEAIYLVVKAVDNLFNGGLRQLSMSGKTAGVAFHFFIPLISYLALPNKLNIFGNAKYIKPLAIYNERRGEVLKKRQLPLGDRNLIGARVTEARKNLGMKQVELLVKLQTAGIDMSIPALSLLEGQKRPVSDLELNALADILQVSVDWLLGRE